MQEPLAVDLPPLPERGFKAVWFNGGPALLLSFAAAVWDSFGKIIRLGSSHDLFPSVPVRVSEPKLYLHRGQQKLSEFVQNQIQNVILTWMLYHGGFAIKLETDTPKPSLLYT
jgi:hypothetical protein